MSNMGVCLMCGAAALVEDMDEASQEERDDVATSRCRCPDAKEVFDRKMRIERAITAADNLFGLNAQDAGFDPLPNNGLLDFIHTVIGLIANGHIKRVAVQIDGETKAILSLGAFNKINIERSEVNKQKVEG